MDENIEAGKELFGRDYVYVELGYVIFSTGDGWNYEVPLRDLDSPYFFAQWVAHLSQKTWITKCQLHQFSEIAMRHYKR